MADEYEQDGKRVVKPKISDWTLKQRERELFASAEEAPNWRLADKARRLLADASYHLTDDVPSMVDVPLEELDTAIVRQSALISISGIVVRSIGSAMAMISCGYLPEAAGPTRRVLEAKLNAQAVLDDSTGQYAIRYLQGRPRGVTKLAQKYGATEDVKLMSLLAHADVRGLILAYIEPAKGTGDVREGEFSVLPFRDEEHAHFLLYTLAYEAAAMCAALAEAFGVAVEIPAWVSGELMRARDAIQDRREGAQARKEQQPSGRARERSTKRSGSGAARGGGGRAGRIAPK